MYGFANLVCGSGVRVSATSHVFISPTKFSLSDSPEDFVKLGALIPKYSKPVFVSLMLSSMNSLSI